LPALYELDIQHNEIAWFPWEILEKKNLRLLIAKDNPFILDKESAGQLKQIARQLQQEGVSVLY
jgi:hypothetical protein